MKSLTLINPCPVLWICFPERGFIGVRKTRLCLNGPLSIPTTQAITLATKNVTTLSPEEIKDSIRRRT